MGWNEFWSNWWDGCQIIGGNLQNAYENVGTRFQQAGDHFAKGDIAGGIGAGFNATMGAVGNTITFGGANALGNALAGTIEYDAKDNEVKIKDEYKDNFGVRAALFITGADTEAQTELLEQQLEDSGEVGMANFVGGVDCTFKDVDFIPISKVAAPVTQGGKKLIAKGAEKLGVKFTSKALTKVATDSVEEVGEKIVQRVVKEGVEETLKDGTKLAVEKGVTTIAKDGVKIAVKEGVAEVTEEVGEKIVKKVVAEGVEETLKDGTKIVVKDGVTNITRNGVKMAVEKGVAEVTEEVVEKTGKEIVEKTLEQGVKKTSAELTEKGIKKAVSEGVKEGVSKATQKSLKQRIGEGAAKTAVYMSLHRGSGAGGYHYYKNIEKDGLVVGTVKEALHQGTNVAGDVNAAAKDVLKPMAGGLFPRLTCFCNTCHALLSATEQKFGDIAPVAYVIGARKKILGFGKYKDKTFADMANQQKASSIEDNGKSFKELYRREVIEFDEESGFDSDDRRFLMDK